MKEFKSIARVIKNSRVIMSVSKDPPAAESLQQSLRDYWKAHIGIAAPHTCPLLFQSGRLVVFCDSAVWGTQIRHQTPSLLRQMNDNNFKISGIDTKVRPLSPSQPAINNVARKRNPISKDNVNVLRHLATKIEHRGLRDSLLRLAKKFPKKISKETITANQ